MNRALPLVILLIMGAMLLVAWSNISDAKTETVEKYNTLMENGKRFEEKKIYVDAVTQYEAALNLRPDYELAMRLAGLYQEMSNSTGYVKSLESAISCDPLNPEPYFMLIDEYAVEGNAKKLYSFLNKTKTSLAESENFTDEQRQKVDQMLKEILGHISIIPFDYDEAYGFHSYQGSGTTYIRVRSGDCYGILDGSLSDYMACAYSDVGFPNSSLIPYNDGKEYIFLDGSGNRKVVPDSPATAIGAFGGGYAPMQTGGKYGYIDTQMNESHFDYDFAGSFENGIAPVQQNGKWFVINTQFAAVGQSFDEILVDAYGFCAPYGVYFGKTGNTWGMYSVSGDLLADGFEEVKQFASTQPAAVKQGGKWGFLSLSGEMVIEPKYEDADSFSIGYAPVKTGSLWGCINLENTMIVDPQFVALSSFSSSGYAIGETEEGLCSIIIQQYN